MSEAILRGSRLGAIVGGSRDLAQELRGGGGISHTTHRDLLATFAYLEYSRSIPRYPQSKAS